MDIKKLKRILKIIKAKGNTFWDKRVTLALSPPDKGFKQSEVYDCIQQKMDTKELEFLYVLNALLIEQKGEIEDQIQTVFTQHRELLCDLQVAAFDISRPNYSSSNDILFLYSYNYHGARCSGVTKPITTKATALPQPKVHPYQETNIKGFIIKSKKRGLATHSQTKDTHQREE